MSLTDEDRKSLVGDYSDRFNLTPEEVLPLVEPTKALLAKIERMIKEEN